MTTSTFLFDCFAPSGERFPIQGTKFLNIFLSEQPNEGIDWRVVARPLPSDRCRFMLVQPATFSDREWFVLFMPLVIERYEERQMNHCAMLTSAEIGQELGGN